MKVSRENWKGHYRAVARDERGRMVTWAVWSQKEPIRTLAARLRSSGTFKKGVDVTPLVNVKEISDFSKSPRIRTDLGRYMAVAKGYIGKTEIVARSQYHPVGYPRRDAIDEATVSFWERVSQHFTGGYDAEAGIKFADQVRGPKFGIIQYAAKT